MLKSMVVVVFCLISSGIYADSAIKRIDKIQEIGRNTIVRHALYNPAGVLKFDEGSGITAIDIPGGNHGTLVNGATWATGKIGNAVSLDGNNDYVSMTSTINPGATDFTLALWFRSAVLGRRLFSQQDGSGTGATWLLTDNTDSQIETAIGGPAQSSGHVVTTNTWYHVAIAHNNLANTITWYVNGVIGITSSDAAVASATGDYIVGSNRSLSAGFYQGLIDDIRIYNRVLSADEIKRLYYLGVQ